MRRGGAGKCANSSHHGKVYQTLPPALGCSVGPTQAAGTPAARGFPKTWQYLPPGAGVYSPLLKGQVPRLTPVSHIFPHHSTLFYCPSLHSRSRNTVSCVHLRRNSSKLSPRLRRRLHRLQPALHCRLHRHRSSPCRRRRTSMRVPPRLVRLMETHCEQRVFPWMFGATSWAGYRT